MTGGQASLSLAELEGFDPGAPDRGGERRFLCPLPACRGKRPDAGHRSLSVNLASGAWLCHRCGARGLLRERWSATPRQAPRERARAVLRQAFGLGDPRPAGADPIAASELRDLPQEPGDWRAALRGVRPLAGTEGEAYLRRRGLPIDPAHEAGVRYSADWYGRPAVLFPIRDAGQVLVACQGRYVDGREDPKARTAGPKSRGAFATQGAWEADPVAIVEAPLDALSLAACGLPALALAGTTAPDWLPRACTFRRVLLATDADPAGDAAAGKLAAALQAHGVRVARLRPTDVKDWNESLQSDPERLRRTLRALLADPAAPPDAATRASAAPPEPGDAPLSGAALVAAVIAIFRGRLCDTAPARPMRTGDRVRNELAACGILPDLA